MNPLLLRLQELDVLNATQAQEAWNAIRNGEGLEKALLSVDGVSAASLLPTLARELDVEHVNLAGVQPDLALLGSLPARLLSTHRLLPLTREGSRVRIATASLFETAGLDELAVLTGLEFVPVLAEAEGIERALRQFQGIGADTVQSLAAGSDSAPDLADLEASGVDLSEAAQDASIIKFVNQILTDAIERRATDVHFEPFEGKLRVRFRIDGVLVDAAVPPNLRRFQPAIVSRLKIISQLDISEKRLPQDGRIKLRITGRDVDVRVSVIPMLFGEAVVLRLLDRRGALTGLDGLGMNDRDAARFGTVLQQPHGIVLVTGPTGSGKTTTLYAALAQINSVDRKIITIEDPIEYHLDGVNQIQVDTKTGLTFGRGLRAVLRHDPDVVLIGEIRDRETAEIAVQASLTGHLVFSTLHTNDAPSAVARLIDMGVEPFLVASSLEMVLAQRLVRIICKDCKVELTAHERGTLQRELREELPATLWRGAGCPACGNSGYRGRQGIFEAMPMSDELRAHATTRVSSRVVRKTAVAEGMSSLREDGWRMVREGKTTVEELMRVTKDEGDEAPLAAPRVDPEPDSRLRPTPERDALPSGAGR